MTRLELIRLLLARAKANGFQLRKWYCQTLGLPWQSTRHTCEMLAAERRYYVLLFSHEFACSFWKPGETITFTIGKQSFQRKMPDGSTRIVQRKSYMRRSVRPDAWRFHLREMALADDPLRYIRRYIRVDDELEPEALGSDSIQASNLP